MEPEKYFQQNLTQWSDYFHDGGLEPNFIIFPTKWLFLEQVNFCEKEFQESEWNEKIIRRDWRPLSTDEPKTKRHIRYGETGPFCRQPWFVCGKNQKIWLFNEKIVLKFEQQSFGGSFWFQFFQMATAILYRIKPKHLLSDFFCLRKNRVFQFHILQGIVTYHSVFCTGRL